MQYNFTDILARFGKKIQSEFKMMVEYGVGVDGKTYKPLKASTVKDKQDKGFGNVKFKRMVRTKDFMNNAFLSSAIGNRLTVWISEAIHGRDIHSMQKTVAKHAQDHISAKAAKQLEKSGKKLSAAMETAFSYRELAEWQLGPAGKFFPSTTVEINSLPPVRKLADEIKRSAIQQTEAELNRIIKTLNANNSIKVTNSI